MHQVTHFFGTIFSPVFHAIAWLLAFFYGLIPNYIVAIVLLTIVIMGLLTPLTVKSTRSMLAMSKLQPEIKKLQQKYKGPENRQTLNDEMMKLYREAGVNPVGGCLPMLLQAPFLFILYNVIKGLSYTVIKHGKIVADPRYIPRGSSKMYQNLLHNGGQIKAWGMDLSLKPFSPHSSFGVALPFFVFVALAVALQYFQMAQINNRNRKTGQAMPSQQQAMQRVLPVIFAFFYLAIPAAVVIYMIVSTGIRIITQDIMFRTGVSNPNKGKNALAGASTIDGQSDVVERPAAKPATIRGATKKPATASKTPPGPSSQARPAPKPQQPRSKAKRKRKAR
jgi:YidC/Oxa1 family membrane protein insertase